MHWTVLEKKLVLNLDEMSAQIIINPTKTYNFKDKTKRVKQNYRDSKVCFTAVCIVGADGHGYDPLFIAEGKTDKCGKAIDELKEEYQFTKLYAEKGWMKYEVMKKALEEVPKIEI